MDFSIYKYLLAVLSNFIMNCQQSVLTTIMRILYRDYERVYSIFKVRNLLVGPFNAHQYDWVIATDTK
jgi:hypothetical protein